MTEYDWCKADEQLLVTHSCAYECYLSSYAPGTSWDGRTCWLSDKPDGAPGSKCPAARVANITA